MTTNYIVEWTQQVQCNPESDNTFEIGHVEEFEFMTLAQMRMIQLESYGFKPVLIDLNEGQSRHGDRQCSYK